MLALGAALIVGNIAALVRPPEHLEEGDLERAPLGRSLLMIAIGVIAAIWGGATLIVASSS